MVEQTGLFTYPNGWNEMVAALDFIPERQRDFLLKQLLDVFCMYL